MDSKQIEIILKNYGLSDKEAKIYFVCLKMGSASVVSIARASKLPKSTCCDRLNSLIEKGLISQIVKNSTRFYEASDPNVFMNLIDEKKKQIESIIPSLTAFKNTAPEKPNITFYEGVGGIKTILSDIINYRLEVRILGNFSNFEQVTRHVAPQFIKKRVERKIKCFYISEDSSISKNVQEKDSVELRKTKITQIMNKQDAEMYIYGTKTAFVVMSKNEPVGVIIDNAGISNLQRALFDNLWGGYA
ncbi:MAG: hypothetical protein KAS12_06045 [Candidatus Aenigmarchaeota archaeon]|nr:hypothetical protein [Candidatus Aenigmarchaeota archaeon]